MKPNAWDDASPDGDEGSEGFTPLSAEEAQALRQRLPNTSLLRVVLAQALVGLVVSGVAWWLTAKVSVAWSALYGAAIVTGPAALFARSVWRMRQVKSAMVSAVGLGVWEGVKLLLTLVGLLVAPQVVPQLSWPAMLVGLLLTMKVYWVALAWRRVFAPNT
jgi:ATP synthase protein I